MKPKFKVGKYVEILINGDFDDLGEKFPDNILYLKNKGFKPSQDIKSITVDNEKFLYGFHGFYLYEDKLSENPRGFQPEENSFGKEIEKQISDKIRSYEWKIDQLKKELEDVKASKESKELVRLKELNEQLVKALAIYKDGHLHIEGDQNRDDCSGWFQHWGMAAKNGVFAYQGYCREFNQVPIFLENKA